MYRSFSVLCFLLLFLAGCQTDTDISANTPKEALEQLHLKESFAKPMEFYESIEIDEGRVIVIYKGSLNKDESIFVANIEKVEGKWSATDATGIGIPSASKLNQRSATESFEAGYTTDEASSDGNVRIVKLKDSDYNIRIKIL